MMLHTNSNCFLSSRSPRSEFALFSAVSPAPVGQARNSRRIGFTLVELLTVIAIISVLAAILFPVFAQARETARQTACMSNEKQMGIAFHMCMQDYDETWAITCVKSSGLLATPWPSPF